MPDFIDVRQLVLSGQVKKKQVPVYLERLGGWFTVRELMGDEKGDVLNNSVSQKTQRVDIKIMYAELFIKSLRYPDPESPPTEPVLPQEVAENAPDEEQAAYHKALAKYYRDVDAYQNPYPLDHPHAGELVFKPLDRDAMNSATPSEIQERVAELAMPLNGMSKDDLDDAKKNLTPTVIDSTLSPSPSASDTSIPT